ncbi:MAG: NUDIX hydrolase [Proteobacteria bacterium]|nr:NUDIX hydrolase [Pseudomonadota bacterium]
MAKIISAARACVINENKLLLVSNNGSYWYLPGGHMEPRENLAACAKREVYEETGYEVTIGEIIYVFEFYDKEFDSHKVECVFRASIDIHPEKHEWEDLGHDKSVTMKQWFTLEEIQARDDVQPSFIKEGKWLQDTENNEVYRGYEESK